MSFDYRRRNMRRIIHLSLMIGMIALFTIGLTQTAFAGPTTVPPFTGGSPSQYCKNVVEPIFQELGVPIGHSTCVTLANGANGQDVGVCKWARDLGAISNNELGQCIAGNLPNVDD